MKGNIIMNIKLLKLAQLLKLYKDISTDKGVLTINGELLPGVEAYVYENNDVVPAPDGTYVTNDGAIVVVGGLVTEIIAEPETNDEMEDLAKRKKCMEEPMPDDKDARIAELEAIVSEKDSIIAEKDAKIAELESKLNETIDKPAEESAKETKQELSLQERLIRNARK